MQLLSQVCANYSQKKKQMYWKMLYVASWQWKQLVWVKCWTSIKQEHRNYNWNSKWLGQNMFVQLKWINQWQQNPSVENVLQFVFSTIWENFKDILSFFKQKNPNIIFFLNGQLLQPWFWRLLVDPWLLSFTYWSVFV